MSQQANKNLVVRCYHEMWNKCNFALVDELLTKDISFRGSLGTETHGRAAFCDYMRGVQGAFRDFHNTIEEMIAERNRACARLTYTGTHRSRLKRRNLGTSLFPENVGVKENRRILQCKTSGGDTDTHSKSELRCFRCRWTLGKTQVQS